MSEPFDPYRESVEPLRRVLRYDVFSTIGARGKSYCGKGVSSTFTTFEYIVFSMSTSIRISEETKRKLEAIKRSDETFDELLARLAVDRTEADVEELAGFADEGIEQHMLEERSDLTDSLDERTDQMHIQLDHS